MPTTLHLAAILAEPRTATALVDEGIRSRAVPPRPLRVVLLDRLGGIADDVSDAAVAQLERLGFPLNDYREMVELRDKRQLILQAVSPFLDDPDPDTRNAATVTAALLLDTPDLIRRAGLLPLVEVAAVEAADKLPARR
ncbi:hypothetical protein AB0C15_31945 [Micromonospora sp. NPDC048835]|uniref:hypothetical protein n=1 Tax=Micromonospora sp. NPDC048835 TaxID=3155147 RepID=UPI00340002DA